MLQDKFLRLIDFRGLWLRAHDAELAHAMVERSAI
jgi:hypothetical protein